ncbi:hypothetical protein ACEUB7_01415 [Aeromonas veronii]
MLSENLLSYRKRIDEDAGLQSKRKLLVLLSVLMLAIDFTGATFKEANTFIFKIEFENQSGLNVFLLLSVVYLLIRYYAYAHSYHEELYNLWSGRMLEDRNVFYYDVVMEDVRGLLGPAVEFSGSDEPGIQESKYYVSGIFKRALIFPSYHIDEDGETHQFEELIKLTKFNDKWTRKKYIKLLSHELKYQSSAFFKYRENLDLIGPYVIGSLAIMLTLWKIL